ncbi:MAG: DUF5666 domain-containing protein [Armatimonadota bacterium]|nr:DUF5666 domain-containing protein [Armatimonadota bacterium]MDR7452428.1 DUF5666 domain-containing protein [Armatimonadota bacterium]MDR7468081.1 DUF5666 domain-containing protein [Armatimonadota bacterium]MDR7494651.1 DUF5666 domain-containing protein [Armatimonadota bacterium]MDR7500216.1 DUF5666 domain-containing protein [Armatimonadota bacterium]
MLRFLPALIVMIALGSAASAAPAGPPPVVAVKGFVIACNGSVLTVRHGRAFVDVQMTDATVVTGRRTSRGEIVPNDLVWVEGMDAPDGALVARRIEVLFLGEGLQMRRPELGVFWNWVLTGSWSLPVR